MTQHPIRTAADAENGVVEGTLLEAMVKRFGYVLNVGESLGDLEFDTGEPPLLVFSATTGFGYFLDLTDSTTPDDGLTTLVSSNGLRYAVEDAASISQNSVLDVVTAPTGSEVVGDAYIVDAAATGDFAGQDDNLAIFTRRGWVFAAPELGQVLFNLASETNTQFTDTGWGAFAVEFAAGSIPPVALQFPAGIVVEDTLNTPPGSPTTGKFWIVGSVPTGAFVGHGADLAYWTGSAWAFMDPADGWSAYHKANGFEVYYVSGSWLGAAGSEVQTFSTPGAATWTKPAKGNMALIECWGAGGSGGRAGSGDGGGGGGGGAYLSRLVPIASLGSTESVTVGAGGPAATSDDANGTAGGNSSFGSWVTAYGGGAGNGNTSTSGGGGGGGGQGSAGSAGSQSGGSGVGGAGGTTLTGQTSTAFGGGAGGTDPSGNGGPGGVSEFGGGGGGSGRDASDVATLGIGGKSGYGGGGGGGGASNSTRFGAGGTSAFGGAGGAGAGGSNAATAGTQPGGGGGGSALGNSGKGGDGRVRVTVF